MTAKTRKKVGREAEDLARRHSELLAEWKQTPQDRMLLLTLASVRVGLALAMRRLQIANWVDSGATRDEAEFAVDAVPTVGHFVDQYAQEAGA